MSPADAVNAIFNGGFYDRESALSRAIQVDAVRYFNEMARRAGSSEAMNMAAMQNSIPRPSKPKPIDEMFAFAADPDYPGDEAIWRGSLRGLNQ